MPKYTKNDGLSRRPLPKFTTPPKNQPLAADLIRKAGKNAGGTAFKLTNELYPPKVPKQMKLPCTGAISIVVPGGRPSIIA